MKKIIFLMICFLFFSCSVKNDEKMENNSGKAEIESDISEKEKFIEELKKYKNTNYSENKFIKFKTDFVEENGKYFYINELSNTGDFNYLEKPKNKLNAILYLQMNTEEKGNFYQKLAEYGIYTKMKFFDKDGIILFEKEFSPEELKQELQRKLSLEEQKEIFILNRGRRRNIFEIKNLFEKKDGKIFFNDNTNQILKKHQYDSAKNAIIEGLQDENIIVKEINEKFIKFDIHLKVIYFDENNNHIEYIFSPEEIKNISGVSADKNEEIIVKDIYKIFPPLNNSGKAELIEDLKNITKENNKFFRFGFDYDILNRSYIFEEKDGKEIFTVKYKNLIEKNFIEKYQNKLNFFWYFDITKEEDLKLYQAIINNGIFIKFLFVDKNDKTIFEKDFSPEEAKKELNRELSLKEQKELFINHLTKGENNFFIEEEGKTIYKRIFKYIIPKDKIDYQKGEMINSLKNITQYDIERKVYENFLKFDISERYVFFDENNNQLSITFSPEDIKKYTKVEINKNEKITFSNKFKFFPNNDDKKIENNSGKAEIEKENSFPYSKILKIKLLGEDDANWKNTLEFLFSKSNSLIVEIDKKEDLNDLKSIGNNKFFSLSFEISEKDIFGKELLENISKANGKNLTFNIKNENIKNLEISDEEKEIFEKLNFGLKEIYLNGEKIL